MSPQIESALMNEKSIFKIQDDGFWTIYYNGRYFRVNEYSKVIIQLILDKKSNNEIQQELYTYNFCDVKIEEIVLLRKLLLQKSLVPKKEKSIKMKIRIINLSSYHRLLDSLSFLFRPLVVKIVLLLFVVLFLFRYDELLHVNRISLFSSLSSSMCLLAIYGIVSLLIVLIHEFGHAVASMKFNVPPKEIGFGFYLFFPVFFTDVSMSWLASKKQRIIVDLAGFYFQIIIMVILLLITLFTDISTPIVQVIILDNIFIIIYNLNPLFRFDGYWLFSDICNIPNLKQKSIYAISEFVSNLLRSQHCKKRIWTFKTPVYIYSIVSNLFIVFVCIFFVGLTIRFGRSFALSIILGDISLKNLLLGGGRFVIMLLGSFFSLTSLVKMIIRMSNEAIQLYRKN